jgi:hypothetical protein
LSAKSDAQSAYILWLVSHHQLIAWTVVLAIGVTNGLAVFGVDDLRTAPSDPDARVIRAMRGVVSPPMLVPRLKGGGEPWGGRYSPIDRKPALAVHALGPSPAAEVSPSRLRFLCRVRTGCRPPPQL